MVNYNGKKYQVYLKIEEKILMIYYSFNTGDRQPKGTHTHTQTKKKESKKARRIAAPPKREKTNKGNPI